MLYLLVLTCFILFGCGFIYANSTDYTRTDNTFTQVSKSSTKSEDRKTQYTWKDSKGTEYPIYISLKGSCYIIKTSSKTGKEYKHYLGSKISKEICRDLHIEYKGKS